MNAKFLISNFRFRHSKPFLNGIYLIIGWIAIVLVGQCVFNREFEAFEWFAAIWLWIGILLVRPTLCIPFIILTYPAFMCESRRAWAWVQPVMVWIFFARILIENKFTRKQFLYICLTGTIVFVLSWPLNAGELLTKLRAFPKSELFFQWLGPHAVWAIFPFRQSVDRAMIAMVCAGVIISGRYFSSRRIWTALWLCALLCLLEAFAGVLLPWQEPHLFLGTTNYGCGGGYLFNGAGFNISFFTICLILGIPWFFVRTAHNKFESAKLGLIGLLLPTLIIPQKAFVFASVALMITAIAVILMSILSRKRSRRKIAVRPDISRRWIYRILIFVLSLGVSIAWFCKMGIMDQESRIRERVNMRLNRFFYVSVNRSVKKKAQSQKSTDSKPLQMKEKADKKSLERQYTETPDAESGTINQQGEKHTLMSKISKKLERRLTNYNIARGSMWMLGLRTSFKHYFWRGAGAGTWARFHRSQPRPYRAYFAHMHNTYLDLIFEYGVMPMLIVFLLCAVAFFRIAFSSSGPSRLWVFYLIGVAVMAMGQHLFYAFTSMCLLLPAFIILPLSLKDTVSVGRHDTEKNPGSTEQDPPAPSKG